MNKEELALARSNEQGVAAAQDTTPRHVKLWNVVGDTLSAVYGNAITKEQVRDLFMGAFRENPTLSECDTTSVVNSVMTAAKLGLQFNTPLQHGWLLPYRDKKTGLTLCQYQLGYKGLLELVRRSGTVASIYAEVVREHDDFKFGKGSKTFLSHRWELGKDRGKVIGVYAVAQLYTTSRQLEPAIEFEVMSVEDVERIRAKSQSPNSPAWRQHWDEMARKTALKKLSNSMSLTPDVASAVAAATVAEDVPDAADPNPTMLKEAPAPRLGVPEERGPRPEPEPEPNPTIEVNGETVDAETGEVSEPVNPVAETPEEKAQREREEVAEAAKAQKAAKAKGDQSPIPF